MTGGITVLVFEDRGVAAALGDGDVRAETATLDGATDGRAEPAAPDSFEESADPDCVVVDAAGVESLGAAVDAARAAVPGVTCVVAVESQDRGVAALEAGATDAAPRDRPALLERRVRNAGVRQGHREASDDADGDRAIRALHDVATRLEGCDTEQAIYEVAVEAAEDILSFDICYFAVVEDGEIRPQAANADPLVADPVIMSVEEGLAGRTVRNRETYVVDDAAEDPDADPVDDSYRAALSIPLGEFGLFQAVATEYAAFDGRDRELGELLAAHVTAAVERVRYAAALRAERDRFAALFERIPDAAARYVLDDDPPEGTTRTGDREPIVDAVNPAFERQFGHDADAAVGRSLVDLVVPEDGRADRHHARSLQDGEAITTEVERETTDGRKEFLLRTAPIGDGETGYVIYTDVSDLKQRERALQRQNARLQQFASIVSHDLRNPLNVAAGQLTLAAEADGPGGDHVGAAREALDRMERLIDDLLALARHGQVVDDPEPVALADAAAAAWGNVPTPGATLTTGELPTVPADRTRVEQLFENLFRNAVEHGSTSPQQAGDGRESDALASQPDSHGESGDAVEHGSTGSRPEADNAVEHGATNDGDLRVEVGPLAPGDDAVEGFYVADDGPGIPAEDREAVFEHGYTTSDDGTGLGLTIVGQVAEAHGWEPRVCESDAGGARFEFRI